MLKELLSMSNIMSFRAWED